MTRAPSLRTCFLVFGSLCGSLLACGCEGNGMGPAGGDMAGGGGPGTPLEVIPTGGDVIHNPALTGNVDLVRDEWGNPHIYGRDLGDIAFAQGYVMAMDRLVQMDLARHQADGTIAELVGGIFPSTIDSDIKMRVHHLRATATAAWDELSASSDATDKRLAAMLTSFAAGINAYVADLNAGKYDYPSAFVLVYNPKTFKTWTAADSLLLGQLQAFDLSFDADSEIYYTNLLAAADAKFAQSIDPDRNMRKDIGKDLIILAPIDPTHTIGGWTGMNGDTSTAAIPLAPSGNLLALLEADRPSVANIGRDRLTMPWLGSNNWIIGPKLSQTGHTLVANDTHLSLGNPATFYLVHIKAVGGDVPLDVMGVQFPGIPGVILGNNEHVAWGGTVNYIDVTDVYKEVIVPCADGVSPCALKGSDKVALVPRTETINVGKFGVVDQHVTVTLYDVPGHGPIIPRVTSQHGTEALGQEELSIRYTGYEKAQLFRAVWGLDLASNMKDAVASLDRDFKYGGQNWVVGDDSGQFGWTQTIRVPRRAAGHAPWLVLPGDGSAEWGGDMDPKYIPHAWNPDQGYLATANADPIGVTDDNDPFFSEPVVDGAPLYLGADYDPGTRVGRITSRIEEVKTANRKLSLDDLQSIQADAITTWGKQFQETAWEAGVAVEEELAHMGTHADVNAIAKIYDAAARIALPVVDDAVHSWSFDTPSAAPEENPGPQSIKDSIATLVIEQWLGFLAKRALGDELGILGMGLDGEHERKLLAVMCAHPDKLATGIAIATGDALLFDDVTTGAVVESKRQIAALALLDALDALIKRLGPDATRWRWAAVHTLTLEFPTGDPSLSVPSAKTDPMYPNGFPRHGGPGTVDVGGGGVNLDDFTFSEGPAIRFVCELDPSGPRARNVLPGGEVFDPTHYHYRDQMELWRKNKTFDLAFRDDDVLASARREYDAHKDDPLHPAGRIRFAP